MGLYFGTDGIRGKVGEDLTQEICFRCGNALARQKKHCKIIIGKDTRTSGSFVLSSFVSGATMAGADIVDVGIIPTPGISFLTKKFGFDYGVMITASHNPAEYNGIKIFNKNGAKISIRQETDIECSFAKQVMETNKNLGRYIFNKKLTNNYVDFLVNSIDIKLDNLKVILDTSNGASFSIASKVFKKLGANVTKIHSKNCGELINFNCGALYPQKLANFVKDCNADVGFAFDGDADRIATISEKGEILDGDQIILFLSKMYQKFGLMKSGGVVATIQTNIAIEKQLNKIGLKLYRTDVGDKFVTEELQARNIQIGGEQSGHIILSDYELTGDAILCALMICKFIVLTKQKLSENIFYDLTKQYTKNYEVSDKLSIINSASLKIAVNECEMLLSGNGRIVVRASGTEPKIRVMIETENANIVPMIFAKIENVLISSSKR